MKAKRPGGRAARVVAAVIDATMREIARVGFEELRVEDVAELAGVAKTTVYRRWPTKIALVVDAMRSLHGQFDVPDTGSVREDARRILEELGRGKDMTLKRTLARAVVAAGADHELVRAMMQLRAERMAVWEEVLQRAIERGELPRSLDVALVAEVIVAPFALRVLRGETVDAKTIDALVDLVVTGAEHSGGPPKKSAKATSSSPPGSRRRPAYRSRPSRG